MVLYLNNKNFLQVSKILFTLLLLTTSCQLDQSLDNIRGKLFESEEGKAIVKSDEETVDEKVLEKKVKIIFTQVLIPLLDLVLIVQLFIIDPHLKQTEKLIKMIFFYVTLVVSINLGQPMLQGLFVLKNLKKKLKIFLQES